MSQPENALSDQSSLGGAPSDYRSEEINPQLLSTFAPGTTNFEPSIPTRGYWTNKVEFLLSSVGYSVGLGNVWRFPYKAFNNGGAAFVVAYLILQMVIGKPLYLLELSIGQYSARGTTSVWTMCPCFRGIGLAMVMISLDIAIYYNVIIAYVILYFFMSFKTTLPWTHCNEAWADCFEDAYKIKALPKCSDSSNTSACICYGAFNPKGCAMPLPDHYNTPAQSFWQEVVLQQVPDLSPSTFGTPSWKLTLCLMLSWVVICLCLIKGVKSVGKAVYFTATFPYVVLLILLVIGCIQEGAVDGAKFFIVPDWNKLITLETWTVAAGQMFFSLSLTMGGIIMYGSFNRFRNNLYQDAVLIAFSDLLTSILAGFVIFTNLGGLARKKGVAVADVAQDGFELAFIVYPEVLTHIPPSQLWSIIFFLMFFTLGLDSEFALVETILTSMQDEWPWLRNYKASMVVMASFLIFLLELPLTCPGGFYLLDLFDHYGGDISLLVVGVFEPIAVIWIYGLNNLKKDFTYMIGRPPSPWYYWASSWVFFCPVGLMAMCFFRLKSYTPPTVKDKKPFPAFAKGIGFGLMALTIGPIPGWFLYSFCKASGSAKERWKEITDPKDWRPAEESEWKRPHKGRTSFMINQPGESEEGVFVPEEEEDE